MKKAKQNVIRKVFAPQAFLLREEVLTGGDGEAKLENDFAKEGEDNIGCFACEGGIVRAGREDTGDGDPVEDEDEDEESCRVAFAGAFAGGGERGFRGG